VRCLGSVPPRGVVPSRGFSRFRVVDVTWWEGDYCIADTLETFDFRCEEHCVGRGRNPPLIECCNADRVSGRDDSVSPISNIMKHETEKPVELVCTFNINLLILLLTNVNAGERGYQMQNDLAIGVRSEGMWFPEPLAKGTMVVYFAVDGEDECLSGVDDRLSARI
jgi:hypothetical protein